MHNTDDEREREERERRERCTTQKKIELTSMHNTEED